MESSHKKLINTLEKAVDGKGQLIDILVDTLHITRESASRRIRGKVQFTFEEVVLLAKKLDFSFDRILDKREEFKAVFEIPTFEPDAVEDYATYYFENVLNDHISFATLLDNKPALTMSVHSNLDPCTIIDYEYLSRFRAFQWIYQISPKAYELGFSSVQRPEYYTKKLMEIKAAVGYSYSEQESTIILSHRIFLSFAEQVSYFREVEVLTDDDVIHIKKELLDLVDRLELLASKGKNVYNVNVWIYVTHMDVRDGYVYVKSENFEAAFVDIYQLQWGISFDPRIAKTQFKWIDSLKKYATLLSASAEISRVKFFSEQRKKINELL